MTDAPPRLIEPVPIDDDLCSGLALIEEIDCGVRLVWHQRRTLYETGDRVVAVKRKIVMPLDAIEPTITALRAFINSRPARPTLKLVE